MSHFKYEIDERNLRLQLRESEVAFTEEAWHKFESFSEASKSQHTENVLKRFHVTLNRSVVLPVVFGAVIILFSFLLFNFVNIKNPNPETAEVKQAAASPRVIKKEPIVPVKKIEIASVEVKDSAAANVSQPAEIKENTLPEKETVSPAITAVSEVAKPQPVQQELKAESTYKTEALPRKKHKRRELIVTEPTAEEDSQLPPPSSDDAASSGRDMQ